MQILNIASYKFIGLTQLNELCDAFLEHCQLQQLKGTILLSKEGINLNLAGTVAKISAFKTILKQYPEFEDLQFKESYSTILPFKRLKVKIKKEIITLKQPQICPDIKRAPSVSPEQFKQWLDEKRDITILDTRNDYEVRFGAFAGATHLNMTDFSEFPVLAKKLAANKPIVMYCTGGIRCEKAGLFLLDAGFSEVYQLEGGILNYFTKTGGAHYHGECFVFDERIALDADLKVTGTAQCHACHGPIHLTEQTDSKQTSCMTCLNYST